MSELSGGVITKNEVVLLELSGADLFLHRVAADVDIDVHPLIPEDLLHLVHVVVDGRHNGNHKDLARTEPERPFAGKVLGQDGDEPFEATVDGPVDHDRAGTAETWLVWIAVGLATGSSGVLVASNLRLGDYLGCHVLKLEFLRQLKVKLDGGALMFSPKRVGDGDVNLRTVKGTIALVDLPTRPAGRRKRVERIT